MLVCKYANVQVSKFANVQVCKCPNVQVSKCASMQLCQPVQSMNAYQNLNVSTQLVAISLVSILSLNFSIATPMNK